MSQKIKAIVFSKDRAAQLKLLLDSIKKNAPGVFDVNVIINHTSENFDKGYAKVIHNPDFSDIHFFGEHDLKNQVISLLGQESEYACFFLDDDILYKEISKEDIINQFNDEDVACFSLRLGQNTTHCYTLGGSNVIRDLEFTDNIIKWDWTLHYLDFGYPFAMDGHIFRKSDILKLVKKSKFTNVEELEMSLFELSETYPRNKMTSYKHSVLVGVPLGRVQVSYDDDMILLLKNNHATSARNKMNEKILSNEYLNLELIDFSNIIGCHQELNIGIDLNVKKEENE